MLKMTNEDYLKEIPNTYLLTVLLARRVKELKRGSTPLIETNLTDPVELALEEIKMGKVDIKPDDEEINI